MSTGGKISTDGGSNLGQNPFAALSGAGLPSAGPGGDRAAGPAAGPTAQTGASAAPQKNRGRVDIVRETGGRGGKTVTVVTGFVGIGAPEKEQLLKKMRAACGCGGTLKDGQIELQGDKREQVAKILSEAGFRPVFAGG